MLLHLYKDQAQYLFVLSFSIKYSLFIAAVVDKKFNVKIFRKVNSSVIRGI